MIYLPCGTCDMETLGNRVVLVAVADADLRRTYRDWIESGCLVWTVGDRLGIYERVTSAIDVVLVGPDLLAREGLDATTFREGTDGCRVVLVGAAASGETVDLAMPSPTPSSLAATVERLSIETACERLLAESLALAETKARFERELGEHPAHPPEAYRTARDRFRELRGRLDEVLDRADVDWPALFEPDAGEQVARGASPVTE